MFPHDGLDNAFNPACRNYGVHSSKVLGSMHARFSPQRLVLDIGCTSWPFLSAITFASMMLTKNVMCSCAATASAPPSSGAPWVVGSLGHSGVRTTGSAALEWNSHARIISMECIFAYYTYPPILNPAKSVLITGISWASPHHYFTVVCSAKNGVKERLNVKTVKALPPTIGGGFTMVCIKLTMINKPTSTTKNHQMYHHSLLSQSYLQPKVNWLVAYITG